MSVQFDANASYGLLSEVKEQLFDQRIAHNLFNPSSVHQAGQRARAILEDTRDKIRRLCYGTTVGKTSLRPRVVFSSGATESNNQALETICRDEHSALITSTVEHPSILEKAKHLTVRGVDVHYVTPSITGSWPRETIYSYIQKSLSEGKQVGLSLMHANNEIGTIYDTAELFEQIHELFPEVKMHADCVQTFGKVSIEKIAKFAHCISISAHKIGALQGVGALVSRAEITPESILRGGPQELRSRSGTENVLGIYSFGLALSRIISKGLLHQDICSLNTYMRSILNEMVPHAQINGGEASQTLLNTFNLYLPGLSGEDVVVGLDMQGVLVSYGSACASGKQDKSHVLDALGFTEERARSSIRCSFRHDITKEEIYFAIKALANVCTTMRAHGLS